MAVVGLRALQTTDGLHDEVEFHIISPTPAADLHRVGVTKNMFTPVSPSTNHPLGRAPLLTGGSPLPESGGYYYHSYNSTFLLHVSKVEGFRPAHYYTYFSLDELARMDENAVEDAEVIALSIGTNRSLQRKW